MFTKGIWEVQGNTIIPKDIYRKAHDWEVIATVYSCYDNNMEANAQRIVTCVNSHDELVDNLKELLKFAKKVSDSHGIEPSKEYLIKDCEQALKKAEEEV